MGHRAGLFRRPGPSPGGGRAKPCAGSSRRCRPAAIRRLRARAAQRTPEPAYQGDGRKCWVLAVQLYGVRSRRNWGHGDFSDLAELAGDRRRTGRRRGSASTRCTRSSMIGPDTPAVPIRRTAGCFSIRSISTSRRSRNSTAITSQPSRMTSRDCAPPNWSTTPRSRR